MTDDNRPMDPFADMRELAAGFELDPKLDWPDVHGVTEMVALLRAHDRHASEVTKAKAERDEFERLALRHEEQRRQAEATCERRTAERDALAVELLDEQGAHAKTADNFAVFACSISDGDDATEGPS